MGASLTTTAPVDGVLYNLVHKDSGKLVHVYGGSPYPSNGTQLVLHDGGSNFITTKFRFVTDAGGKRQLQHFSSGLFIHPHNGVAGNDVPLVVHETSDGSRTSMIMVRYMNPERTHLEHGVRDTYKVHPSEGKTANNTPLVFKTWDSLSTDSIIIQPAETFAIVDFNFDEAALKGLAVSTRFASEVMVTNSNAGALTTVAAVTAPSANTFTFSQLEPLALEVRNTYYKAALRALGKDAYCEVRFDYCKAQTMTSNVTPGVVSSKSVPVELAGNSGARVSLVSSFKSGQVPFTAFVRSELRGGGEPLKITGTMLVEYFYDQRVQIIALKYSTGWARCTKCELVCQGDGKCPASGTHTQNNNYKLMIGEPSEQAITEGYQGRWGRCDYCKSVYYFGGSGGKCCSGGTHVREGAEFRLPYNSSPVGEPNWSWCSKCDGIWCARTSSQGVCPAGGGHIATGSGNYQLSLA